jgi:Fe-S-cluster-containing dehydrogenase component
MSRPTLVIDLDRCIGCHSCTVACQIEHAAPARSLRMRVYQIGPFGAFPLLQMHYLPVMCQHCQNPPCLEACPTGATRQNDEGLVWVNKDDCIGCGACVDACPFKARYVHPASQIAEACDQCRERDLPDGQPVCATSCSTHAIRLCNIEFPDPISAQWLKKASAKRYEILPGHDAVGTRSIYLLQRQPWAGWEKIKTVLNDLH